jgi:hypothetical protein
MIGIWRNGHGTLYLCERHLVVVNRGTAEVGLAWRIYEDFKDPVQLPAYIPSIANNQIVPLSIYTAEYDMRRDDGFNNIGAWIDAAAIQVGR